MLEKGGDEGGYVTKIKLGDILLMLCTDRPVERACYVAFSLPALPLLFIITADAVTIRS